MLFLSTTLHHLCVQKRNNYDHGMGKCMQLACVSCCSCGSCEQAHPKPHMLHFCLLTLLHYDITKKHITVATTVILPRKFVPGRTNGFNISSADLENSANQDARRTSCPLLLSDGNSGPGACFYVQKIHFRYA